jgi:long-chain acyl-CoA synthetase
LSLNLASIVFESAQKYPNEMALACGLSYQSLEAKIVTFGCTLQTKGLKPGDRVALMSENRPEFTVAYFAILAAGGIVVPINTLLSAREVAYCLEHSQTILIVHSDLTCEIVRESVSRVQPRPAMIDLPQISSLAVDLDKCQSAKEVGFEPFETSPDDTAVIFYTSGTTGRPKGAEVTHFNLYSNALWVSERSLEHPSEPLNVWGPGHCTLALLALSHSFGQTCMQNAPLLSGGCVAYVAKFDAHNLVHQIAQDHVTILAAVPRMIKEMLALPDLSSKALERFQYCLVGGAPINQDVVKAFEDKFQVSVLEGYGLSETSPVIVFRSPGIPRKDGSVGRAIRGVKIRVVDEQGQRVPAGEVGEIVVRGQAVMKGYHDDVRETELAIKRGWLHTGDLGFLDEDGDVFLVDRKTDMIIRNGYNVYPAEVESVLCAFPGVIEAAVVGVDDEKCGQEIKAYIVGEFDEADLLCYCRKELAAYKYPRVIARVLELPKGHKGQLLRRMLRS